MVTVLAFGSFDRLHPGHLYYLREAKKLGDRLVVVLARDRTIEQVKGRVPRYSEQERKLHLETTGIPDEVVLGHLGDKHRVLDEVRPDVIALGYDQRTFAENLEAVVRDKGLDTRIVRLGPYKSDVFKSSKL